MADTAPGEPASAGAILPAVASATASPPPLAVPRASGSEAVVAPPEPAPPDPGAAAPEGEVVVAARSRAAAPTTPRSPRSPARAAAVDGRHADLGRGIAVDVRLAGGLDAEVLIDHRAVGRGVLDQVVRTQAATSALWPRSRCPRPAATASRGGQDGDRARKSTKPQRDPHPGRCPVVGRPDTRPPPAARALDRGAEPEAPRLYPWRMILRRGVSRVAHIRRLLLILALAVVAMLPATASAAFVVPDGGSAHHRRRAIQREMDAAKAAGVPWVSLVGAVERPAADRGRGPRARRARRRRLEPLQGQVTYAHSIGLRTLVGFTSAPAWANGGSTPQQRAADRRRPRRLRRLLPRSQRAARPVHRRLLAVERGQPARVLEPDRPGRLRGADEGDLPGHQER